MAVKSDYVTGTITLTNGLSTFTGAGTAWALAGFREGDEIKQVEGQTQWEAMVATITSNTGGTLVRPWGGATGTYAYRMRFQPDGSRVTAQARELIELLGDGTLLSLAGLAGPGVIELLPGGGAQVVPRTDLVSGANYDVQVANLAARAAYNGQASGFSVLVADAGGGRAAIYSKLTNASADWSAPAYVTGPAITLAVTEVDEVPYGTPPDVTLTPVVGGYNLAFEIPRGMIIEAGTTTTLAAGQPAAVTFVPISGGYRLDIAIPRGPTGDINGVTSFWVSRLGADADAGAALTGLGAQPALGFKPVSTSAQTLTSVEQGRARANIGAGTASWNWIINPDFTINQRGGVKKPANGVYGYDRWKGHANGIEQIVEALPAGEYTLTWSGGGSGTFGGITGSSPIKSTVVTGNAPVVVPQTATRVSLVEGDATGQANSFSPRHIQQELALCERYYRVPALSGLGWWNDTTNFYIGITFTPPMRTTPTPGVPTGSIEELGAATRAVSAAAWSSGQTGSGGLLRLVTAASAGSKVGGPSSVRVPFDAEL